MQRARALAHRARHKHIGGELQPVQSAPRQRELVLGKVHEGARREDDAAQQRSARKRAVVLELKAVAAPVELRVARGERVSDGREVTRAKGRTQKRGVG
jgi:hypothetical protein